LGAANVNALVLVLVPVPDESHAPALLLPNPAGGPLLFSLLSSGGLPSPGVLPFSPFRSLQLMHASASGVFTIRHPSHFHSPTTLDPNIFPHPVAGTGPDAATFIATDPDPDAIGLDVDEPNGLFNKLELPFREDDNAPSGMKLNGSTIFGVATSDADALEPIPVLLAVTCLDDVSRARLKFVLRGVLALLLLLLNASFPLATMLSVISFDSTPTELLPNME